MPKINSGQSILKYGGIGRVKILGVEGVGLYGGTIHKAATALDQVLTPEEIKRGGTGSRTNKAFDRYYQPHKREHVRVITAIKKLKKDVRGELIALNIRNES